MSDVPLHQVSGGFFPRSARESGQHAASRSFVGRMLAGYRFDFGHVGVAGINLGVL